MRAPVPARLLLAALVCLAALQTTLAGVDGDSLLSTLPAILKDLERIDTAWTALDQRIEQTCG
jgi:hypothetical protein